MNIYTVVFIYKWSIHGDDIKKIFHNNNLNWNSSKVSALNNEELEETLKKFHTIDGFNINKDFVGLSGIWEDSSQAIKIIRVQENVTSNPLDDVILIHKGNEELLYREFLKKCGEIGAMIIKIIDDEIVFRYRRNVELINDLNDIEKENELKIKNFKIKAEFGKFSEEFKSKWIELMRNS